MTKTEASSGFIVRSEWFLHAESSQGRHTCEEQGSKATIVAGLVQVVIRVITRAWMCCFLSTADSVHYNLHILRSWEGLVRGVVARRRH